MTVALADLIVPSEEAIRKDQGNLNARIIFSFLTDLLVGVQGLSGAGGTQTDLIFTAATELTIASGAITATQASHTVDTQSDAASDDLDTMAGGTVEEIVILRPANAARTVVIKHAIGANCFACPSGRDISLAEATDFALCYYDGTQWIVPCFSTLANGAGGLGSALASVANGLGAALVGIEDSATWFATATVEAALAEIAVAIGGSNSTTRNYTSNGYVADNATVLAAISSLDAALTAYRDQFVQATLAVADTGGGGTAAALTLDLIRAVDGTDPATVCQVLILAVLTQYAPVGVVTYSSATFGTATVGSIVASGTGWALVATDATGNFACTASDSVDEAVYFRAITAEAVSSAGQRCVVVSSNSDVATWSA